ncbi:uncharacterized protein MELLADRAFT_54090 [Melampsora larici-populina 98AG31]|uniref:hydroxymethylglutaryl-CoA lyase n=1 Tax=Melampsora larici-populina (strain 98AG31 / pathotype 3-4-7) TaxID=747676 RepID=F4S8Q6_MELLP|nr:uncharacterized protein MELLADRAFT_54090 [Melampsora larici-populina 98AG31]EGF98936.1 hypothetical protein MELLADRAFT_54090 [Melampsora larici-populina 98AG31]
MEVSPRDGLQNEPNILPIPVKAELIRKLVDLGLRHIEVGSFVSPKWVPQMASTAEIICHPDIISSKLGSNPTFSVLMPNRKGLDGFKAANFEESPHREPVVDEIALFASATEGFSQANLNSSVSDSIEKMRPVAEEAQRLGLTIRGYVSCVFGCPFEGKVDFKQVASVSQALFDLGCYEVAISDTIGVAVPSQVTDCLDHMIKSGIDPGRLGIHCHDTFGTSLANILTAVSLGVKTVDSSIGGIGGCPYSPDVATEDVVYALESSGYSTGILDVLGNDPALLKKLEPLADAGNWINSNLGRSNSSRVGRAVLARKSRREKQAS